VRVVLVRKRRNVAKNTKPKAKLAKNVRNLTNTVMRLIFLLLLLPYLPLSAQELDNSKPTQFIGTELSFSYRNKELFHGLNYTFNHSKFSVGAGIKLGVKSSYFQSALFPQLNLKFSYLPIQHTFYSSNKQLSFGPQIHVNTGIQRVATVHSYSDFLLGYDFSYGNKWRFVHSLNAGSYLEIFKDDNENSYSVKSLTYYLTFGIQYALN
jgi:hypothetical protein